VAAIDKEPPMPGRFVWYDLMTVDMAAAEAFYRAVVGWDAAHVMPPPDAYTTFNTDKGGVAGLMEIPEDARAAGARPVWSGYVGVPDVDDYTARVTAAGGTLHHAPEDIPGVGRFSVVADPQGTMFELFKGNQPDGPPRGAGGEPGYVGWHELMAADAAAAFDWYSGLFGWVKTDVHDMGPMGSYLLWTFEAGAEAAGGMMTKPAAAPHPHWNFYIQVDSVAAAAKRIVAAGGTVINGPMEVPGGDWVVQGTDPQGAMFSLMSAAA
jgi:uncharacterized protein